MNKSLTTILILLLVLSSCSNNAENLRSAINIKDYAKTEKYANKIKHNDPELYWILTEVIKSNDTALLKIFSDSGIDLNIKSKTGNNILIENIENISDDILIFLIENGFNASSMVNDEESLLYWALKNEKQEVISVLLKNDADVNFIKKTNNNSILHLSAARLPRLFLETIANNVNNMNIFNDDGYTPLGSSIRNGRPESAKILIECGADINMLEKNQKAWTFFAYNFRDNDEYLEIADLFLENGLKINSDDFWGLHAAVIRGKENLIEWFLINNADVNQVDVNGAYPIDYTWKLFTSPDSLETDESKAKGNRIVRLLMDYGSVDVEYERAGF